MSYYKRRPRRPPLRRVLSVGMGVTSSMRPMRIPERARARRADCAAGLGVRTLRSLKNNELKPTLFHQLLGYGYVGRLYPMFCISLRHLELQA